MNKLEQLDLSQIDSTVREIIENKIKDYNNAQSNLNNVTNESQVAFDRHRLTFPDDFNFEAFLTQNNPAYHEAIFRRNQARNKLNNILKDYFLDWDQNAI